MRSEAEKAEVWGSSHGPALSPTPGARANILLAAQAAREGRRAVQLPRVGEDSAVSHELAPAQHRGAVQRSESSERARMGTAFMPKNLLASAGLDLAHVLLETSKFVDNIARITLIMAYPYMSVPSPEDYLFQPLVAWVCFPYATLICQPTEYLSADEGRDRRTDTGLSGDPSSNTNL